MSCPKACFEKYGCKIVAACYAAYGLVYPPCCRLAIKNSGTIPNVNYDRKLIKEEVKA